LLQVKNYFLLFTFLFSSLFLFSQEDNNWVVPNSRAFTLDESELDFLSNNKLRAEEKIKELLQQAEKAGTEKQRTTSIRKMLMAIMLEEAENPPISFDLAKVHIRFGDYLNTAGAWKMGIEHSKIALDYMRKSEGVNSDQLYNMIGKVGSYYMLSEQFDSAKVYYNLALAEAYKTKNPLWISAAYNNLGILLGKLNKPTEATEYFIKAKESLLYKEKNDTILLISILDNVAEMETAAYNYQKAIEIYNTKIELAEKVNLHWQHLKSIVGLCKNYLLLNNRNTAFKQLKRAELFMNEQKLSNITNQIVLAQLWQQYYEQTSNWHEAALKQKWVTQKNDSIEQHNNLFLNEVLQAMVAGEVAKFKKVVQIHKLQLQQKEKDLQIAEQKARFNKILAVVFISLAVALILLIYLFYRNRSNIQKTNLELKNYNLKLTEAELKNRELEKEKLARELEFKKGDLNDLTLYLSNLKEANTKMLERLNEAKNKKPEEQKELIKEISTEMLTQLSSDKKTGLIKENVSQINKEFYDKLLQLFPDLTKSELELCGLFRLNISNKEIGVLKNISPESVKMSRYRLRKKLGLKPGDDIYRFVTKI
jgi:hypothetical protein